MKATARAKCELTTSGRTALPGDDAPGSRGYALKGHEELS
jgi:hypothetical protein